MAKSQKKTVVAKTNPDKQVGFFANLPVSTVVEIRRRSTKTNPQWKVIRDSINATKPKPSKKVVKRKRAA